MEEIGLVLRKRREELGLRQVEVAKESGINPSRMSMIENTWIMPRFDEVDRIKAAMERLAAGIEKDSQ